MIPLYRVITSIFIFFGYKKNMPITSVCTVRCNSIEQQLYVMISDKIQQRHFLSLLNEGDVTAYNLLYKEYYELMVLYACRLTGNCLIAEDFAQDVFVSIWERRVQFADYRSIRAYLYRSVRNYCINYSLAPRSKQVDIDETPLIGQLAYDPDLSFIEEEVYKQMFTAIDLLPKCCREIMLKVLEGKKNTEISAEMSLSIETVKTQKRRGKEMLRKLLDSRL